MAELTIVGLSGRYVIERELGRGGMGAVYLALDRSLDRLVAIKVLPAELAKQGDLRERFLRETRTAASFSHPNIVPVHGVEEGAELLAFTMGYVEGESLTTRIRRTGPMSVRDAVKLLQDVGWALAYAHGRGVVHRDIKPDNILIDRATGRALVTDFGIARAIAAPTATAGLTRVGEVVGTPEFMSPEQATGDVVDGRSDLYSLGLVAFFALTGELAVSGDTTQKMIAQQLTVPAPPLLTMRPELPSTLAASIDRLLLKDPSDRFASAEELVEELEASQLAGPDVAVPIRVLDQDLTTTGIVAMFILIFGYVMQRNAAARGISDIDIALPAVFLVAILWGRVASTLASVRRVAEAGFPPDAILQGFRLLAEERDGERARLRLIPSERQHRRRAVIGSVLGLLLGVALVFAVINLRVQVGPTQYNVPTIAVLFAFAAFILFGLSLVTLTRSPFRASLPDRLYTRLRTGAVGGAILRFAARGARVPSVANTTPPSIRLSTPWTERLASTPESTLPQRSSPVEARLSAIEGRLSRLEERSRG